MTLALTDEKIRPWLDTMAKAIERDGSTAMVALLSGTAPIVTITPQMFENTLREELPQQLVAITAAAPEVSSIAMISDTWGTKSPTKLDGTPWQHGELTAAVRNQTPDAALVNEVLATVEVTRDGEVSHSQTPYTRVANPFVRDATCIVVDHEARVSIEGTALYGHVHDMLRAALQAPQISWDDHDPVGLLWALAPATAKQWRIELGIREDFHAAYAKYASLTRLP